MSATQKFSIASIPADGVGKEVVSAGRRVLDALAENSGGKFASDDEALSNSGSPKKLFEHPAYLHFHRPRFRQLLRNKSLVGRAYQRRSNVSGVPRRLPENGRCPVQAVLW